MSFKIKDYQAGREDGLDLALRIVKEGGIEELEKEVRFRGISGIHTGLMRKELDEATEKMKSITYQTLTVAWLSVLHDTFGFGQIRCQRAVDKLQKLTAYLDQGWLYWYDLIVELKEKLKLTTIETDEITKDSMGRIYRHPDPEDVYDEADLVNATEWKNQLLSLGFSEKSDGKTSWVLDENGKGLIHYEGEYGKIQAFDILYGMDLARDHWDIK